MIKGIYTSTSGMLVQKAMHEVISNNIANMNTPGFKRDVTVFRDNPDMFLRRIDDYKEKLNELKIDHRPQIGTLGTGAVVEEVATIYEQGPIKETGNDTDIALEGDGFFAIYTKDGIKYTRDGTFSINSKGVLVTRNGEPVMVTRNPKLGTSPEVVDDKNNGVLQMESLDSKKIDNKLKVDKFGRIYVNGKDRFRFCVVKFDKPQYLRKEGNNTYVHKDPRAGKGYLADETIVRQGEIEGSNINVMREMVTMISAYRAYETCQKTLTAQDSTLDKAVNSVGRVM